MGVNSLPKTATRLRRGCDLNPGPTAPESSTLTTRLPSHPVCVVRQITGGFVGGQSGRRVSRKPFRRRLPPSLPVKPIVRGKTIVLDWRS